METRDLGKTEIADNPPVGVDARFEPEYEALEAEIAKLSSPADAQSMDWNKVVELASAILERKSKNFVVACYMSVGLLKTGGLRDFATGVHVLRELMENFWEPMFPPLKRIRARRNAMVWLLERVDAEAEGLQTQTWKSGERDEFIGDLTAVDNFLSEKMEDAPIMQRIIERLGGLIDEEPAPGAEPQPDSEPVPEQQAEEQAQAAPDAGPKPPPAPTPPPPPVAAPAPNATAENAADDPDLLVRQGLDILSQAATACFRLGQLTPLPFQLNRLVAWMRVDSLPPADGGKTMIPPPDGQTVSALRGLYQAGNWTGLLDAAESHVRQFLFWLDLSHWVHESAEQMGLPAVRDAVAADTASYVKRLPGIEKLAFSDGTPFADEETREWLRSITSGGDQPVAMAGGGEGMEKEVAEALAAAQSLAAGNKLAQALSGLCEQLNQASSLRERFLWELALCRLLVKVKKVRLAVPYIQEILQYLDEYKVDKWEPALALDALTLVLTGLRLQEESTRDEQLIERVINRISVINPAAALDLV